MNIEIENENVTKEKETIHKLNEIVYDKDDNVYYLVIWDGENEQYKLLDINTGTILEFCSWETLEEMDDNCSEDIPMISNLKISNKNT